MSKRRRNRKNVPAGRDAGPYMTFPYAITQSVAFRTLPGSAVKVLIELRGRHNGSNNGHLRLSLREAKRLLQLGESTISRAFKELQERGFIKMSKPGQWYGRLATEWELTFLHTRGKDGSRALATRDYNNWRPDSARSTDHQKQSLAPVAASSEPVIAPVAASSERDGSCSGTMEAIPEAPMAPVAARLYSTRGPGRARGG